VHWVLHNGKRRSWWCTAAAARTCQTKIQKLTLRSVNGGMDVEEIGLIANESTRK
jgi:hypothetical protein